MATWTVPTELVLIGAGEHARVVAEAAEAAGRRVLAALSAAEEARVPEFARSHPAAGFHIAIGGNRLRQAVAGRLAQQYAAIVHPTAWVSPSAELAPGVFVGPHALVHAGARVGAHSIVNSGALVEHDAVIGSWVHIAPGAVLGGRVRVGDGAMIGLGARIRDGIAIGAWAVVAMGAVAVGDVRDAATVLGVPARERG